MNPILLVAATGFTLLMGGFGILFATLIKGNRRSLAFSDDPHSIFSSERYQEMERLLDIRLSFQQGGSSLRKERVKMLRSYINQLSRDFHSICAALKFIMVNSQIDRPDLAKTLITQRFLFLLTILTLNCKLVLYRFGWNGVGTITASLHLLSTQLRDLAVIAQPEAACC